MRTQPVHNAYLIGSITSDDHELFLVDHVWVVKTCLAATQPRQGRLGPAGPHQAISALWAGGGARAVVGRGEVETSWVIPGHLWPISSLKKT